VVCDQYDQVIHISNVHTPGNVMCDSQSAQASKQAASSLKKGKKTQNIHWKTLRS